MWNLHHMPKIESHLWIACPQKGKKLNTCLWWDRWILALKLLVLITGKHGPSPPTYLQ